MRVRVPLWWYIAPLYLTLWTLGFGVWNFVDGNGMMEAFGVDAGGASPFIMLNSAARYLAIGAGMVLGIWVFRTYASILTALGTRLVMDVLDLVAGLQTGLITNAVGAGQSFSLLLTPNAFASGSLLVPQRRAQKG